MKKYPGVYEHHGRIWIRYYVTGDDGQREQHREPTDAATLSEAADIRAARLTEHRRGERTVHTGKAAVNDALDAVLADYRAKGRDTVNDAEQRAKIIRDAIGSLPLAELTTARVQRLQAEWRTKRTPTGKESTRDAATVNRTCNLLRRGCRLLTQETPPRLHVVPYIPRLKEKPPRGKRITASEAEALQKVLPEYLRDPFVFATATGIRRGQQSRTLRRFVDLDTETITWPAAETKAEEEHPVPLVGDALDVVRRAMADARPCCPYLFHGLRCGPDRARRQAINDKAPRWGCLGDFKNAWTKALKAAGVGHRRWHDCRVTFATEGRASGLSEGDCMVLGGWKTRAVFDRYNLGDVEALRARLAAARDERAKVLRLRKRGAA